MEHYDVLIATPGENLEADYVASLVDTLIELNKKNISYKWLNGRSSLVGNARELTISGGGLLLNPQDKGPLSDTVTYNKIFWIDSDISWTVDDFFKLYNSEHQIATGVYLLGDATTTSVHAVEKPGGMPAHIIKGMSKEFEIRSCGFGFIAVKSGVFESMHRPWFGHYHQDRKLEDGSIFTETLGEDISWCIQAYEQQIPIYCYPDVMVNHHKILKIDWTHVPTEI
jgi:hypothetical protein